MLVATPAAPSARFFTHRQKLAMATLVLCSALDASCSSSDAMATPKDDAGHADSGAFVIHKADASVKPQQPQPPCDSTFLAIARLVFAGAHCTTSNCHAPGPDAPVVGLDLTESRAYQLLVDVAPAAKVPSTFLRVNPGDEQSSLLYRKLVAAEPGGEALPAEGGAPMPIDLPPVAADHLAALRAWIRAGADETGVTPTTEDFVAQCAAVTTAAQH